MPPKVSDFMLTLATKLTEKGLSESSIMTQLRNLKVLNGGDDYKNLQFLRDEDKIQKILDSQTSENSQRNLLAAAVSSLSVLKDNQHMKALLKKYQAKLDAKGNEIREAVEERGGQSSKTHREDENWIDWDEVIATRDELFEDIQNFIHNRMITEKQQNQVLKQFVLSLQTYLPPRRNNDQQLMYIVKKQSDSMPKDRNYLDLDKKQLIFNSYKTSKKYGQQVIDISKNEPLLEAVEMYLTVHPTFSSRNTEVPMLLYHDGSTFNSVNSMTRLLNKIFGKKVGASMLRHSYLSSKQDISEMEKDSEMMAHSVDMQRDYLRKSEPDY